MPTKNYTYKTGLVLSGGGARGFAHIGAIKALHELGIFPEVISGTSAGAIVGAFIADGHKPEEIINLFLEKKFFKFIELIIPKGGLLKMSGLIKIMSEKLKAKTFEELQIPLYICATDFTNAKCVYFNSGDLFKKVIASATVPVLFTPMVIDNCKFVDGGIMDNFPIAPIAEKCKNIIGININPIGYQEDFTNMASIAERAFHMSIAASLVHKAGNCCAFLEPPQLKDYKLLDISKSLELFNIGYKYTHQYFRENTEKLDILRS